MENPLDFKKFKLNQDARSLQNSRLSNKSGADYAQSILGKSSDMNTLKSIISSK